MKLKIRYKIFIAIMAIALFSVIALQSVQRHNFEQGLRRYSDDIFLERLEPLSEFLASRYEVFGGWDFIQGSRNFTTQRLNRTFSRQGMSVQNVGETNIDRNLIPKSVADIISLLDVNQNWVAGANYIQASATRTISLNGQTIGYLALQPRDRLTRNLDRRFAEQQGRYRLLASLAIILAALFSAILISRNLGKPIKDLNEHVQSLSDGDYEQQLDTNRSDEFQSLSQNFNKLAKTLSKNRDQRRQWVSDIAHELRTPVSILQAELECIEDGLQPLNMDTVSNLKSEVERMNLLIDDLHQLSQADAGTLSLNCYDCDLAIEIQDILASYQDQFKQKELSLTTTLSNLPKIECDPDRMRQVIANLIQNTMRYTDSPGEFHVHGEPVENKLRLIFEDSSPGVSNDKIDKIFDRLYRVDPARSNAEGASGLGLSICASIVSAHHGSISAHSSTLGGLAIKIELPFTQPKSTTDRDK